MQVQSLSWEDPLEEEMATCSSILARIILWTEEPGGLQSLESQRGGHNRATGHARTCIHNNRYYIFSLWIRKQFREIKPLYMSKPGLKLKCDSECCAVTMILRCLFTQQEFMVWSIIMSMDLTDTLLIMTKVNFIHLSERIKKMRF